MSSTLTETMIAGLPVPERGYKLHYYAGRTVDGYTVPVGFAVRVMASGVRSFLLCYGNHRNTLGQFPKMRLAQAIREAAKLRLAIDAGAAVVPQHAARVEAVRVQKATVAARAVTVSDVLDDWLKRHEHLRTIAHCEGVFRRYVRPAIGELPIYGLRKRPIVEMVDTIRDSTGVAMSNKVVADLQAVLRWFEARDDDFVAPVLRGLKTATASRDRILTHEEIAALWPAFGQVGAFGVLCKLLLLTGQRRSEIADLKRSEIDADGATLTIPASRYKTQRDHTVPLSAPVRELLAALPPRPGSDRFFSLGFGTNKERLDALAPSLAHWTLHDLRRTATSLMIEAGIRPDYVERVTHPQIAGIAGVYNRYAYLDEKRMALDALAAMVERIVNPTSAANVVQLRG